VEILLSEIPLYHGAKEAAQKYGLSKPMRKNLGRSGESLGIFELENHWQVLLADPQTSGGLLISINENKASELCRQLMDLGVQAIQIGQIKASSDENKFIHN